MIYQQYLSIVIKYVVILHFIIFILLYFALFYFYLYLGFPMHCIACPCILLVSHFTCIKGLLSPLAAQAYKLQVVPSRQSSEPHSLLKPNTVLLTWQLKHINPRYFPLDSYQNLILFSKQPLSFSLVLHITSKNITQEKSLY